MGLLTTSELAGFDIQTALKFNAEALIGIDEAGRGPLAGPVVACACFVPEKAHSALLGINDSKKLTALRRSEFFEKIKSCGVKFAVESISADEIDRINILQATFKAMRGALKKLSLRKPKTLVMVDGPHEIPEIKLNQLAIIGGDGKSLSIATASVIAKVARDNMMADIALKYPDYGFDKHKGYGTCAHYDALSKYGPCDEHRRSFLDLWHLAQK
ncbi:MAG: ribonuclease HII [Elusimicrobia bacterium]|nr:ribonuclease HII [Elusimicrobiota bacterium]